MEDYTTTWKPVFDDYVNFAKTDSNAKLLADEITNTKLMLALTNFKTNLPELDRYRDLARQLHARPLDDKINEQLQSSSRKLGGMAQDIVDQCQIILSRCKDIVNFITMARATITEALHKKHLIAIMKAVTYIIKGVEDDEKKFSPRTIQQTLDQIRRAA